MTSFRIKSDKIFFRNGIKTAFRSIPDPPTEVTGSSGNNSISLVWTAPEFSGTSPITDYIVQYSSDNGGSWTTVSKPVSTSTSLLVSGLVNAQDYLFRVAAVNQVGTSSYSINSNSLAPFNYDPNKLVLVYDTSKESVNNTITLHVNGTSPNILVDWGDGTSSTYTATGTQTKTYTSPGIYVVQISGSMTRFGTSLDGSSPTAVVNISSNRNRRKLVRCLSFGNIGITSLSSCFLNSINLIQVPLSIPSAVSNMSSMFKGCTSFNQPIGMWNVSNITNMTDLFVNASSFNRSLNSWDVSKLTNAYFIFNNALAFNQPLNKWDLSSVVDAIYMLDNARSFNQPIEDWNISNLYNTQDLLRDNISFNQSLAAWPIYGFDVNTYFNFSNIPIDIENYSRTLIGWANFVNDNGGAPTGVSLLSNNRKYHDIEYTFDMPKYRPFWKENNLSITGGVGAVAYGNGRSVGVGANTVVVSDDGISWTNKTISQQNWADIAYGNGVFVAVSRVDYPFFGGVVSEPTIIRSVDFGETWIAATQSPNMRMIGVCYDGSRFIGVGTTFGPTSLYGISYILEIFSSLDGNSWTKISDITASAGARCNRIRYLNGAYYVLDSIHGRLFRSIDAISWTQLTTSNSTDANWYDIAFGNNVLVMVGGGNSSYNTAVSTDGINWQTYKGADDSPDFFWYSVIYANGLFIKCGYTGLAYSRDGKDWIRFPFKKNNEWYTPGYHANANRFFVFGSDNLYAYSSNTGKYISASAARNYLTAPIANGGAGWSITGDVSANELVVIANKILRQTVPASTTNVVVKDSNYTRQTNGEFETDYDVRLLKNGDTPVSGILVSNNTNVITNPVPASGGLASFVFPGVTKITGTDSSGATASVQVVTERIQGSVVDTFSSFVNGTTAHNISSTVDTLLAGKTASSSIRRFSAQNHTTNPPSYPSNASFWASALNFSCCSVWNSTGLNTMGGTLISPRHILFAAHYQINTGAIVRFIDSSGNVVNRTMVNKLVHPDYKPYYPDIAIGVLDSDVPATVSFAKVLPTNWASYLPNISYAARVPIIIVDQEEKALVGDIVSVSNSLTIAEPVNSQRLAFWESIITGDSGSPGFVVINNELVLVTVLTYGGLFTSGTFLVPHISAINTMMNTLGGGYQLSTANLTGFPSF
jgi:surface protein